MFLLRKLFGRSSKPKAPNKKRTKGQVAKEARQTLLSYKKSKVVKRVEILTCNDQYVCPTCRKLSTQTFTLDQALKKMPIPHACTSPHGCRCRYGGLTD